MGLGTEIKDDIEGLAEKALHAVEDHPLTVEEAFGKLLKTFADHSQNQRVKTVAADLLEALGWVEKVSGEVPSDAGANVAG